MTQSAHPDKNKYWRSLADRANEPEFLEQLADEFPAGAAEMPVDDVSRRQFMKILGASAGLAGVTGTGCWRKPVEKILPYAKRPEDLIPGKPLYYATSFPLGGTVQALLVASTEGRPTKAEGNPDHPFSRGTTSTWAQASVLSIYDPDRSTTPTHAGEAATWDDADKALANIAAKAGGMAQGKGLALLIEGLPSPTFADLVARYRSAYPMAKLYRHDLTFPTQTLAGLASVGVTGRPLAMLDKADVVVALDSDFLGTEGDTTYNCNRFADRRRLTSEEDNLNRLYVVEPNFSVTGASADNRLRRPASQIATMLRLIGQELFAAGVSAPAGAADALNGIPAVKGDKQSSKWAKAIAKDLKAHPGKSVIMVGERQPAACHALAALLNEALGNTGKTVAYVPEIAPAVDGDLAALNEDIKAQKIDTLVMLGGNPVYTAPADLEFAKQLPLVKTSIHASTHVDETSELSTWHLPLCHPLEAWGDARSNDGTTGVQQPLIAPIFPAKSEIELLAALLGEPAGGHDLVQAYWKKAKGANGDFAVMWKRWLHDGVIDTAAAAPAPSYNWSGLAASVGALKAAKVGPESMEINFVLDHSLCDGRFANSTWLQELPDAMTKIAWDNAALLSVSTARRLKVGVNDVIKLEYNGRTLKAAAFVAPGLADDVIVLPFGYGRSAGGEVLKGPGFNAYALQTSDAPYFGTGVTVKTTGDSYELSNTQEHGSMEGRPIIREATLTEYRKHPEFVEDYEVMEADELKSLWKEPHPRTGNQWGMSIDLTTCTGCGVCITACQAENNIPVVGKERMGYGRELHWIRMDRYYVGDEDNPTAALQPVTCMQCENAPCESVCPVAATTH
ncbi:TAT-variant-translocated molybdopterin oxidoreductase, partial [bacterium]|nr:TAT-variant-translocated molybdopterin oxidoreductase [bacterium]